ncbi:MAG: DUF2284 domain-containing protein [Sedimentisphaerales bacterium]|nr:DUF2284 domain-containing protein [Sedimentisphaerales bacterium]
MKRGTKSPVRKAKLTDSQLCKAAKQKDGVLDTVIINPSQVVTAPWVRLKCQFGCDGYGLCLVCPPFTPTDQEMRKVLDSFNRAVLLHCHPDAEIKAIVADLERDFFLSGAYKTFGLGAGPCYFCKECDIEQKQCRYPERARPAMEACGIDVFSTARKAGFEIEVLRTTNQCPNYYGLILVD